MARRGLAVLLLVAICVIALSSAQQDIVLYTYAGDVNVPVCQGPVEVIMLTSDYEGLSTSDAAYQPFYSNVMVAMELRQRANVRLALIITSSLHPTRPEIAYDFRLSGTASVTASVLFSGGSSSTLPALLQRVRQNIFPSSDPLSEKVLLLFTDDVDAIDIDSAMVEARRLRQEGFSIAAITNNDARKVKGFLGEVAGSMDNVFVFGSALHMAGNVSRLLDLMCNERPLPSAPTQPFLSPTTTLSAATTPTAPEVIISSQPASTHLLNVLTTFPTPPSSQDLQVSPRFGPETGGTTITVSGSSLQTIIAVRIDSLPCRITRQEANRVECETSSKRGSSVPSNQGLNIGLVRADGTSLIVEKAFTYISGPVVQNFYPLSTIVSGGRLITVKGGNLDDVSNAELVINFKENGVIKESFQETCIRHTDSIIVCSSPRLHLPASVTNGVSKRSALYRIKRQSARGRLNGGAVDFSVGVKLDGLSSYVDFKGIDVYRDPSIFEFDTSPHKQKHSAVLEMKGSDLSPALEKEDYFVTIGNAECRVTDLTATLLTCQPSQKPSLSTRGADGGYDVQVIVGTGSLRFEVGRLVFEAGGATYTWPIVAGALGAAGLLFSVIATCIIRCYCLDEY